MMQGGHQSEPVNSTSTFFFSFFALASAESISVIQLAPAVAAVARMREAIVDDRSNFIKFITNNTLR